VINDNMTVLGKRPVFTVWTDVLICPTMTL
jgi:hypothetical protein